MKKLIVLALSLLTLNSCTVYTEKQSEALSQNVYATKDSIDSARIDLADGYINEATRIVKPPKKRISISGIYQASTSSDIKSNKERVVIVPEKYKNDRVVVVGSNDYEKLLEDRAIASQLKKDNANLANAKTATEKELTKQAEYASKIVKDLNILQKKLLQKDLVILRLVIALATVSLTFLLAIYLRIKGVL